MVETKYQNITKDIHIVGHKDSNWWDNIDHQIVECKTNNFEQIESKMSHHEFGQTDLLFAATINTEEDQGVILRNEDAE